MKWWYNWQRRQKAANLLVGLAIIVLLVGLAGMLLDPRPDWSVEAIVASMALDVGALVLGRLW